MISEFAISRMGQGTRLLNYLLFASGLVVFYLLPVLAGIFFSAYGFSEGQVGVLLSADMAAGSFASLVARYWIHRSPWRPILLISTVGTAALNGLSAELQSFEALLITRSLAGFGAGTMMAFAYASFAGAANADREFSIALAAQVALGAAVIVTVSWLGGEADGAANGNTVFVIIAVATLLPIGLYRYCPPRNPHTQINGGHTQSEPATRISKPVVLALITITLFLAALTMVWASAMRVGDSHGFDASIIAYVLSGSLLLSFLGAASPAALVKKYSRNRLVTNGYVALFIAVAAIGVPINVWVFAAALCIYNFFYSFVMPLQSAWVAGTDITGRNAVLVPIAQGIGGTLGPLIAGFTAQWLDYNAVAFLSLCILGLSFLCAKLAGDTLHSEG